MTDKNLQNQAALGELRENPTFKVLIKSAESSNWYKGIVGGVVEVEEAGSPGYWDFSPYHTIAKDDTEIVAAWNARATLAQAEIAEPPYDHRLFRMKAAETVNDEVHKKVAALTAQLAAAKEEAEAIRLDYSQHFLALLRDERLSNGEYVHVLICNGNRQTPIGTPGKLCNCKNFPLFERLKRQAKEQWETRLKSEHQQIPTDATIPQILALDTHLTLRDDDGRVLMTDEGVREILEKSK